MLEAGRCVGCDGSASVAVIGEATGSDGWWRTGV